jgi:hypothetical protein
MLSDLTTIIPGMSEHPKLIGDRTTLAVMLALIDVGLEVSVPFGENCRYDLVVDRAGDLTRVQCKTGRLRDGAVRFATASTYAQPAIATQPAIARVCSSSGNGQGRKPAV